MLDFLKNEGVSPKILSEIEAFRAKYPTERKLANRIPVPRYLYYGKDVWEEALTALLCGENLLLVDKRPGSEWLSEVDEHAVPATRKPIVEPWKCPYHNGRMCYEMIERIQ